MNPTAVRKDIVGAVFGKADFVSDLSDLLASIAPNSDGNSTFQKLRVFTRPER